MTLIYLSLQNFCLFTSAIDFNVVNPSNNTFNRQKITITIFLNETKCIFEKNFFKNPLQNWLQKWLQTPLQNKLQTPLHLLQHATFKLWITLYISARGGELYLIELYAEVY